MIESCFVVVGKTRKGFRSDPIQGEATELDRYGYLPRRKNLDSLMMIETCRGAYVPALLPEFRETCWGGGCVSGDDDG